MFLTAPRLSVGPLCSDSEHAVNDADAGFQVVVWESYAARGLR